MRSLGLLAFAACATAPVPDPALLAVPGLKLHLYGKHEARPGRKMGHLTALANCAEEARATVIAARQALTQAQA